MMFIWFAALLLCPIAMFLMMRHGMDHSTSQSPRPSLDEEPLEIARTRLARGEITGDQYDVLRRTLTGGL